ncbi:19670_t:CDS:2 [Funneliformis geosporum]|uniref:19670_t:CDS:1 n=1 Tax=Funneliformis geosporum TaxID=1117311 RepID=A0A9W4WZ69_9GLOM|nr:19670_t:CDS:2 [Funneliformis geosporum]
MNKDQLQKELKEKIKAGIKPSDLKKPKKLSEDEGYESDKSDKPIPKPPLPPNNSILTLQKQIELHKEIKKADEKKKQELQEKIKTVSQEKDQYKQTIKQLETKIQEQGKTIQELKKQGKNTVDNKEETIKTFFCDACQLTKIGNYVIRKVDSPFEPRLHEGERVKWGVASAPIRKIEIPWYTLRNKKMFFPTVPHEVSHISAYEKKYNFQPKVKGVLEGLGSIIQQYYDLPPLVRNNPQIRKNY